MEKSHQSVGEDSDHQSEALLIHDHELAAIELESTSASASMIESEIIQNLLHQHPRLLITREQYNNLTLSFSRLVYQLKASRRYMIDFIQTFEHENIQSYQTVIHHLMNEITPPFPYIDRETRIVCLKVLFKWKKVLLDYGESPSPENCLSQRNRSIIEEVRVFLCSIGCKAPMQKPIESNIYPIRGPLSKDEFFRQFREHFPDYNTDCLSYEMAIIVDQSSCLSMDS